MLGLRISEFRHGIAACDGEHCSTIHLRGLTKLASQMDIKVRRIASIVVYSICSVLHILTTSEWTQVTNEGNLQGPHRAHRRWRITHPNCIYSSSPPTSRRIQILIGFGLCFVAESNDFRSFSTSTVTSEGEGSSPSSARRHSVVTVFVCLTLVVRFSAEYW